MQTEKIEFLKNYLSLYINHDVIMDSMNDSDSKYVILDVRNAPKKTK